MTGANDDFGRTPFPLRDRQNVAPDDVSEKYCELVSLSSADVSAGIVNDTWFAFASGEAPCQNMNVQLSPLIYIEKPEYWGIQVIGCVGEICLPATKPYQVWLNVTDFRGHKGIEIIGSNQSIKLDIP